MTVPVKIPDLGAADDNVTLVRWLVEEGAEIIRGQKIAAIETDKAMVELESVAAGVLLKKCAAEGEDATTGDIIAYVGRPGDLVPETANCGPDASRLQPEVRSAPKPTGAVPTKTSRADSEPRVSPMVRNLAKKKGVNLDEVVGTGIGGTITRQDILAAVKGVDGAN